MIRQRVELPHWGWKVYVYYAVDSYYADEILSLMEEMGASRVVLSRTVDNLRSDVFDTGLTYSNADLRTSVMVVGRSSSAAEFNNTLNHESGHVTKHICQTDHIDPFSEEAEYILGELSQALFPVAGQFLCERCRRGLHRNNARERPKQGYREA